MSKVIRNNNVSTFDVDDTMAMWKDYKTDAPGKIKITYGDEVVYLTPHKKHVLFLKHCFMRGDTVVLWSKNGFSHAEQVARALNIMDYITIIMSKPARHIDDRENISAIVGERVYIPDED